MSTGAVNVDVTDTSPTSSNAEQRNYNANDSVFNQTLGGKTPNNIGGVIFLAIVGIFYLYKKGGI